MEYVVRSPNRAGVRLLLACCLAKLVDPRIDIRKPYTELNSQGAYSGRNYDEAFITPFIYKHGLPCNPTTAFLTPALRTKNLVLTRDVRLGGKPPQLYENAVHLLNDVHEGKVSAQDLLTELIRLLVIKREGNRQRIEYQLAALREVQSQTTLPLSSEAIVTLMQQHLASPHSSRLPVLVVAAYLAAEQYLKERVLSLQPHTAADEQTGAFGDVEITLIDDNRVVTSYEMKTRRITTDDIERAVQKTAKAEHKIDNYIFITTEVIEESVRSYAAKQYERTGGVEITVLDCMGFLRHFLHLFHRLRIRFLEAYQNLLLAEPESAVRQELKESFLTLRRAAETAMLESDGQEC